MRTKETRGGFGGSLGRTRAIVGALGLMMSGLGCECGSDGPGLSRLHAEIAVEPTDLVFGEVPLGATSILPLSVSNKGTDVLRVCLADTRLPDTCAEPSRVEPEGAPFFAIFENPDRDNGGAWIVEKGETRDLTVRFTPATEGAAAATLVLRHNAANGPSTTIALSGSGVAPRVDFSAELLDFGEVTVAQRKVLELTLTNGTRFAQPISIPPLAQSSVVFGTETVTGGETPAGDPYRGEVPARGALTIRVFYRPPEDVVHANTLEVSYCPTCAKSVRLLGIGVKPVFELVPAQLDFGTLDEGQASAQTFVVRNISRDAPPGGTPPRLTVSGLGLEAGTTNEFTTSLPSSVSLPAVLAPGEELLVTVTYAGVTPGRDTGRVQVDTNAWDDPSTPSSETTGFVSLQAISTGPDIHALPPAVNFGTVAIGGTPATRNLILENAGNAPLSISAIMLNTPTTEIATSALPGLPATLDPATSIQVSLSYAPQDSGLDEAEIVVVSNDRDEGTLTIRIQGIGGVPTTCSVSVAPTQVTFGLVERGRIATLPVEVRNAGAQPCTLNNIGLSGAVEFALSSSSPTSVNVPPGSAHRVDVAYAPTAYGNHSTLLEFASDDPAQPTVSVPISGASAPSDLLVVPSQLDFNVVPVTCRSPNRAVTLYNTGSNAITVSQVYLDPSTSAEFELQPYSTPTTIPAGGQSVINLRYHPMDIGSDTGVLFIVHSGAQVPVAVPLSGEGQLNPTVTDTFNQLPTPQADVLFVVDNSGSMFEEQAALGGNLGAFISFAQSQQIDYQIAVTTTDIDFGAEQGRFVGNPKIITPSTSNASGTFQSRVTSLGTGGSPDEQGLEAAYLALSDPLINTSNAGFLRPDAALAVIIVSDEEDHSPRPVSFYENFLRNIKGFQNASLFSLSAVVGMTNPTCSSPNGSAEYAARYIQIAQSTGGVAESICNSNWGQTLANIGLNSFGLKRQFQLSSQPVPVTIAVSVDGAAMPSVTPGGQQNWTYDQASNSIVFDANAVPDANSVIAVTYTVACLP